MHLQPENIQLSIALKMAVYVEIVDVQLERKVQKLLVARLKGGRNQMNCDTYAEGQRKIFEHSLLQSIVSLFI